VRVFMAVLFMAVLFMAVLFMARWAFMALWS
jgi:hypothetical protein